MQLQFKHLKTFFLGAQKRAAVCLFHLLPCMLVAQAPGYMGKKVALSYGFNASPAIWFATPRNNQINTIHEISLDVALDSKWLMGVSGRFYRTVFENTELMYPFYVSPEGNYNIRGTTLCLNFKYFKRNYVAPWGSYFMISPVLNIAKTSYDQSMYLRQSVGDHDTIITDFGLNPRNFYYFDFMFGWGKTRVIADRIIIDYGINFQFFSILSVFSELDLFDDGIKLDRESYIEETNKWRVHGLNRCNAFIKVGYLF